RRESRHLPWTLSLRAESFGAASEPSRISLTRLDVLSLLTDSSVCTTTLPMGRGRMAVLSIGILGACSLRPAPASAYGEPQIIDHAEQFSAQGRDGTNCTWAVSFSWDVW